MRIVPGNVLEHSDRSASVPLLSQALAIQPEIIYNVANLYEDNETAFSSFLARRGLTMKGLYADSKSSDFQVIGNRQIKWAVKGRSERKARIVSNNSAGATPGLSHATFLLTLDNDWFVEKETLLCWDVRTVLYVREKTKAAGGNWNYTVQMMSNDPASFVDPQLIAAGSELSSGYTAYPEGSEDASERVTHPEWHTEWMTIQRFKYSTTGSAKAHKILIEHKGKHLWAEYQHLETLAWMMKARERQLLFGRATVDATGNNVGVTDKFNRDIIAGNGLIHQGDPSMKFTYTDINVRWIENLITSMQLSMTGGMGGPEIVIGGGLHFINEFHRAMRSIFEMNPIVFAEGSGNEKGVNTTFKYYNFNSVKLVPIWIPAYDDPMAAQRADGYGVNYRSRMGFALNTGQNLAGQNPNIKLLALGNSDEDRRYIERELVGMAGGGVRNAKTGRLMVSSSVDAYELHMLCETGIALMNPLSFVEIVPAIRR
jgi:hypothetical protein